MPQKTNLNVSPYFDDFDVNKNFYKILFRPGYSIQTRELTSLQSILQNQIESYGRFQFKQGDLVIPGEVGLNTKLNYVKLSSVSEVAVNENDSIVYKKYDIKNLVGTVLRGINSGVTAKVIATEYITTSESDTIYVTYTGSGDDGNEETFRQGETLEVVGGINTPLLVVGTDGSVLPTTITVTDYDTGEETTLTSPAMGYATAVKVEEGIYFVNGFFVRNSQQILVIDKYYSQPSAKVGFSIVESIVTPEQDGSLYDNARGFTNASAPGSHRLKISLELKKYDYDQATEKNFIQLVQIKNGVIEKKVKPADYTLLEETLARRTYDESGDYVVKDFSLDLREYYQNNNNNGIYKENSDGLVNGLTKEQASTKMIASIGPGKAYVRGFEIVNKETKYLEVNKSRDTLVRENVTIKYAGNSSYRISNVYGSVPLNAEGDALRAYPDVYFTSVFNDGSVGENGLEDSSYYKFTTNRRSKSFGLNQAIKTIYIRPNAFPTQKSEYPSQLWYIKVRSGTATPSVDYVDVLSYSLVTRPEISEALGDYYLEVKVLGEKVILDNFFIEYDEGDSGKVRKLFLSQSDAENNEIYAELLDYNPTITPVIGIAKPKDFSLVKRAEGFNQDLDVVISKGKTSNSSPYSGIFNFSYFNPIFFTKILLESEPSIGFETGKYVSGKSSKAYGVIESDSTGNFSSGNVLFVNTLSGEFVSGETLIDESGNTVKIATENTISHFVSTQRGRNHSSSSSIAVNGTVIDSSKVTPLVANGQVYGISIKDRFPLRDVYVSPPSVDVLPFPENPVDVCKVIPVLFKNVVTNYTPQNVKSFYSEYNSNVFTADIDLSSTEFTEYKQISNFTFSGKEGFKYLECNGFGTNLAKDLIQGDIIQFTDGNGNVLKNIVQLCTDARGAVKSRIYLDYALPNDVGNTSVVRLRPTIKNAKSSLVFPTGSKQVRSLINDSSDTRFKYFIRKDFVTDLSASGGNVTFTAQLPYGTQRFAAFSEENYILTVLNPGDSDVVEKGDIIYINKDNVDIRNAEVVSGNTVSAGSALFTLPRDYFGSIAVGGKYPTLKLTATVEIDKAKPRLKTAITNKRIIVISAGDRVIPFRGKDYDTLDTSILTYSDAYKLRYVYEGSSTTPPTVDSAGNLVSGTDVTYKYTFDNGQRDTLYDVSRVVLKPGYEAPLGQLVIAFDYFEHSQGDFCTVDSYLHEAGVTSEEIPFFNSNVHGVVRLSDVIDFRPKVDSDAIISGFQDSSIIGKVNSDYINFTGSSGVFAATPASDSNIEYTCKFNETQYLDRIDGIFLNKKGDFIVKEGNSSLNPSKPDNVDDAIALAYLHIPSYTLTSKDVRIVPVDNRRYTMRDIGKLEKRIERLEYYTTLSILEQQALNMQIKDEIGLDRFKSGFIVDNFESHGIGNLSSIDYKCAIDTQQSILRPETKEDSIGLEEYYRRDDERSIAGYKNSNGIVTLPFNSVRVLGNEFATKTINPNPFVVIQYVGDGSLSPSIDQWYDTSIAPLVTNTNTSHYSIFLAKPSTEEAFASLHNSFIVNWVGTDASLIGINSLGETNSERISSLVTQASIGSSSNISPQNNEVAKGISTKTVNGNRISSSLQFFARSIPVKFSIQRIKPNTTINVFIDGRNINRWVNPDSIFTGVAGNSLSTFGTQLKTNENGNLSGIILIPAGYAPVLNSRWTGNILDVDYDTTTEEIRISAGEKSIVFTSASDYANKNNSETYAEVKYYSSGIIPENPSSIVSTSVAYFKANEGVQLVNSNTDQEEKPNPLAQTFKIENFKGGLFATGVDLFFNKKDDSLPIKVYLSNIDTGKPGKFIVPGSESILYPETYLRVYLTGDVDNISIRKNEYILGKDSNAYGPILKVYDKNNVLIGDENSERFLITKDQVYTLVLKNHNGTSFLQNEELEIPSVTDYNNRSNTGASIKIAKDSGRVVDLKVTNVGDNYESATVTIESPQLPGGSTAAGDIRISDFKIYDAEVALSGSGYTEAPSVVIKGVGTGAGNAAIESIIEIDTPAIRMGVAVDDPVINEVNSLISSRFNFKYPVYLQNDTEYALVVETDSTNYEMWASRLGETEIATSTTVNSQPLLGSVYKSQNTDNWTEDIFEDIKFSLYRAEFNISRPAELLLTNKNLGFTKLEANPIETSVRSSTNSTSTLFKNNNTIVKVIQRDHGFEDSGMSYVFFKNCEDVGGISKNILNTRLFRVANSGIDTYTITTPSRAGSNVLGGGSSILASYNRKYEKLYAQIPFLQFEGTQINSFVKTTNITPVDSNSQNFPSYTQQDYEKTFLNQEHFFGNQKVISSRINETLNALDNSLLYKLDLSSDVSYLSPVIDLRTSSVKTSTTRIENSSGKEDRFGKRYQVLKFLPLYELALTISQGAELIKTNYTITGSTSKAVASVVDINLSTNRMLVKLRSSKTLFQESEALVLTTESGQEVASTLSINGIVEKNYSFTEGSNVIAYYPSDVDITYSDIINGKVILWDSKDLELTLENSYYPINGDYSSPITLGSAFSRLESDQSKDIFRVGDVIKSSDGYFVEVSEMTFDTGVDYVPETNSKNSSAVAKYVTKEVSINSPGTSIDVKLTANVKDTNNIKVLYRTKETSTQNSLEDTVWNYFNIDGNPDNDDLATPENSSSSVVEKQSSYQEFSYSIADLPEFTSFSIKIVMKSDDPAYPPKIQDVRAVASY